MNILDFAKSLGIRFEPGSGVEAHGYCPFHKDTKISFSLNTENGLWKCFASCGGGNVYQLTSRIEPKALDQLKNLEIKERDENEEKREVKPIPTEEVESFVEQLRKRPDILEWLRNQRGVTEATAIRYKLGYSKSDNRITIPIKVGEHYVNIRKYDYLHATGSKFISYGAGYGSVQLWPMEVLETNSSVILFEGEVDCLLALELQLPAITTTGGAGAWDEDFNKLFKDKNVYICYDIDGPGRRGAAKIGEIMSRIPVRSVQIISLPITEPENGDFSDYILRHGHTKEDFQSLLDMAKPIEQRQSDSANPDGSTFSQDVKRITLNEIGNEENFYKRVSVDVIVSGKDLSPYFSPKTTVLQCSIGREKCYGCPKKKGGSLECNFAGSDRELLKMIDCREDEQKKVIAEKCKIKHCTDFVVDTKDVYTVEHIRVIPELNHSDPNTEYVSREVYCLSSDVKTNESYKLSGIVIPHPKTQYATLLADAVEPKKNSLDDFVLTDEQKEQLKVFQVTTTIEDKLAEIYDDLSHNVTHIYNRNDLLLAMDLVYHSVMEFDFMGKHVTKGWSECLIIGDTRCGKSETAQALLQHYKLGELCTGENTSYAGLVGGMSQLGNRWSISWGKIPLNDRRLIVLDESSGLKLEDIANLSGIRSSGIAEIIKIQTEKTHARTRLIWLSNSRSGRPISSYAHGVLAVKELIGKTEDIARFDFAMTVAAGEVNVNEIFKKEIPRKDHKYNSELCKTLLMWAWSRVRSDIYFDGDAVRKILEVSEILGRKYSTSIPLVEGSDERIKIARLSAGLAARLFSSKDGHGLYVGADHVDTAYNFLIKCYDKPSMAYDLYSKGMMQQESIGDPEVDKLKKEFLQNTDWQHLVNVLMESQYIKRYDLLEQIGYDMDQGRYLFKWLSKNHFIKATGFGYVKTPAFVSFLKQVIKEKV